MYLLKYIFNYFKYHFFEVKVSSSNKINYYSLVFKNAFYRFFLNKSYHCQLSKPIIIQNKIGKFKFQKELDSVIFVAHSDIIPHLTVDKKFSIAIDIGANIGLISMAILSKNKFLSSVYSVEASPKTCEKLNKNISINQLGNSIIPLQVGIGQQDGEEFFFHDSKNSGLSSFEKNKNYQSVKVKINSLATFIKEQKISIKDIGLLKVDVEGGEWEVFKNSRGVLKQFIRNSKIIIEIYENQSKKEEIFGLLEECDFFVKKITDADYCFIKN